MEQLVDARGLSCPEPVILTKQAADQFKGGSITVLVDLPVAKENVSRFAKNQGFQVAVTEENDYYKIVLTK